jgi:hypothetical protein
MKCMSCGANIPPEWVNAIKSNVCPGCGGDIMNSDTKGLLDELSEAMAKMPNDPNGVAGWLLSNYRFQKIGDASPVEKFHTKGNITTEANFKVDPTYNEFIKRNDAEKLVSRTGELAEKFKGSKNGKIAEFAAMVQNISDPYGDDEKDTGSASEDDQKAYMELKASGFDPFANSEVSGGFSPAGGGGDLYQAIDPKEVASLLKNQNAPIKEEMALSQTAEGRKYLQRDQFKKLKAQDAITSGGGFFRR